MTTHDVLAFAVSSLIGFFAGYGAGWMGKATANMENAESPQLWWLTDRARTTFGLILVVLSLASIGLIYVAIVSQRRIADCQAQVNLETVVALQARAKASRDSIQAEHDWLAAVADVNATPKTRLNTTLVYIAALERFATAQDQNPLVAKQCN